jgi:hypothetical protein
MHGSLAAVPRRVWGSKWGKAFILIPTALALVFLAYVLWDCYAHENTYAELFLPISVITAVPADAIPVDGLALGVNHGHRQGVLFFVANVGTTPVRLNTRPLRLLQGLAAWVEEENGTRHSLEIWPSHPEPDVPPCEADIVTLKPGERFSQSVLVRHPEDRMMREFLPLPYKIRDFVLTFECVPAPDAPKDLWRGKLSSNPFQFTKPQDDPEKRYRRRTYPDNLFRWRLGRIRDNPRDDVGMRLLTLKQFCALDREGVLRGGQFEQALQAAMDDESPLVRRHAAAYRQTWPSLLIDANADVRRAALAGAADARMYPPARGIAPLLVLNYYTGSAEERLLAIEAFARNNAANEINWRQYIDFIQKAVLDDDPRVRRRAEELFGSTVSAHNLKKWSAP